MDVITKKFIRIWNLAVVNGLPFKFKGKILKKSELINNISKDYYSMHGKSYNITPLCNTLQTMRNDLAHYNKNGRYEESRLFAIRLLEIMIYCMQLSCCNISDNNIVFIIQYIFNN